ncbi:MAG: hypothetical protein M0004_12175 [Actinomycetota bacterium]|nr:hypothetical protein [Actinomycetota bacterium]
MELKTYLLLAVVFPWLSVSLANASKGEKRLTWILELAGHLPAVVYAMFVIVAHERPHGRGPSAPRQLALAA